MSGITYPRHFFAQNLVPNPSFEVLDSCPSDDGQLYNLKNWFNPNAFTSPDLYSSCSFSTETDVPYNSTGFQQPRTDSSYIGLIVGVWGSQFNREYASVRLTDTLKKDSLYCVRFYVNAAEDPSIKNAHDGIGIYLSVDSLYQTANTFFQLPAQIRNETGNIITDTANWVEVSGYYVATGGEQFITLGCFWQDSEINWLIEQNEAAYLLIDDVSVTKCSLPLDTSSNINFLNVFPNPNSGEFTISYRVVENKRGQFSLWDDAGRLVYRSTQLTGKFEDEIHLPQVSAGLYLWRFDVDGNKEATGKLIIAQ